jgi:N-alpha-acetyltransferase 15/16, NatA auxiliary subunit
MVRKGGGRRGGRKGGHAGGRQQANTAQKQQQNVRPAPSAVVSQELPAKEQGQWKNVAKYYEQKQWKKALKLAEQLLSKYPKHGETLAMKGLILSCQGHKEEAHRFIKEGLRYNLNSHVCWHVYGIVHRNERNYVEAAICYKRAVDRNSDNNKMRSDLCTLLVHTGQYEAHGALCREVLLAKSDLRSNWFAFAVAQRLAGEYDDAARAITDYLEKVADNPTERNYVNSELLLFVNDTYEAKGDLKQAYEHLFQIESQVTDLFALRSKRARLALQLGLNEDATAQLRVLFRSNYENADLLEQIWQALGLRTDCADDRSRIVEELAALQKAHPRSKLVARAPLFLFPANHPLFLSTLHREIVAHLRKGAISLYGVIKPLYQDEQKVEIVCCGVCVCVCTRAMLCATEAQKKKHE